CRRRGVDDDAERDRPGAGLHVDGAVEDAVVVRVGDAHAGAVAECHPGEVDARVGAGQDAGDVGRIAGDVVDGAAVRDRAAAGRGRAAEASGHDVGDGYGRAGGDGDARRSGGAEEVVESERGSDGAGAQDVKRELRLPMAVVRAGTGAGGGDDQRGGGRGEGQ